jgi:hypothetical protein
MSQQASVRSVESLQAFREQLIQFMVKFSRAFESVSEDLKRASLWLESEQRVHYESQHRKCLRMLEQAEAELLTARNSEFIDTPAAQQMNVRKWRAATTEVEEKLQRIRYWTRQLPTITEPILRAASALRFSVDGELKKGIAQLEQLHRHLDDYLRSLEGNANQNA